MSKWHRKCHSTNSKEFIKKSKVSMRLHGNALKKRPLLIMCRDKNWPTWPEGPGDEDGLSRTWTPCHRDKKYPEKVTKHSHGMTIYPVDKWVVGGILLGDFKPDQLREHMKNISPENCVPFLSSQSFESKYSFNLEKYTGMYSRKFTLRTTNHVLWPNHGLGPS